MRVSGDTFVTALATGLVGALAAWSTLLVGRKQGQAAIVTAIQEAAHIAIADLKGMYATVKSDLAGVRKELKAVTALKEEIAAERARCEAELAHMRSEFERVAGQPLLPWRPDDRFANTGSKPKG